MRSAALQACRPLRSASRLLVTTPPARSASTTAPRPVSSSYARPIARKPAGSTSASAAAKSPSPVFEDGLSQVLDPQAAIAPGYSVADVDPDLAASIPNPGNYAATTTTTTTTGPSQEFTAAISSSTGGGGLGGGAATPGQNGIDWSSSFHGLSTTAFPPETAEILMAPLDPGDVEVKPDGIIYLPEIKYRRILNRAFGPGGWGLAPRGELVIGEKVVTREYALVVHGRFVAQARGECQYFAEETIPTAGEGCKSNALMRCCKDLGIASELWDPRFIREFKKKYCKEVWVEHVVNKKRRQVWILKDGEPMYPYKLATSTFSR